MPYYRTTVRLPDDADTLLDCLMAAEHVDLEGRLTHEPERGWTVSVLVTAADEFDLAGVVTDAVDELVEAFGGPVELPRPTPARKRKPKPKPEAEALETEAVPATAPPIVVGGTSAATTPPAGASAA